MTAISLHSSIIGHPLLRETSRDREKTARTLSRVLECLHTLTPLGTDHALHTARQLHAHRGDERGEDTGEGERRKADDLESDRDSAFSIRIDIKGDLAHQTEVAHIDA